MQNVASSSGDVDKNLEVVKGNVDGSPSRRSSSSRSSSSSSSSGGGRRSSSGGAGNRDSDTGTLTAGSSTKQTPQRPRRQPRQRQQLVNGGKQRNTSSDSRCPLPDAV
uniref:Uncharacterized protein n=1 Tax=Anopheles dirus TaxID=7168 RepID=A0A182NW14_9DIPT